MALVREYAQSNSDEAFATLVSRHVNLVYSVALRHVWDPHLAEEITQGVFIVLARKAKSLNQKTILSSWLCRTARYISADTLKIQRRRQLCQQKAQMQSTLNEPEPVVWNQIAPFLDEALSCLGEKEHDAVVLRFFDGKELKQVGAAMGTTEDAARMRVNRGLEKLRRFFIKKGLTLSSAALAGAVAANSVQAAPAGLAVTISSAALAGAAPTPTIIAVTKAIAMTTLQKSIFTATVAVLAGAGIYQTRQASQLREQVEKLQQQGVSFDVQNQQLLRERDNLTKRLAAVQLPSGQPSGGMNELLRLRGEVTRLRQSAQELAQLKAAAAATGSDPAIEATLKSWATLATRLRERLEQMPDKKIPELQLLTQKDWFDAIKNAKQLETDADFRQALHQLRNSAKQAFGDMAMAAIKKYAEANGGALPGDWSQLKPFFKTPVDDATLARYSLLQTGRLGDVPPNEFLFTEKAPPVDEEYDSVYEFRMNGTRSSSVNSPGDIVWDSLVQFAKTHNGNLPAEVSQLMPYLTRPLDQAKVQEILGSIPSGISTIEQLKAAGPK